MHPFRLPEFYLPWPARLNSHLEQARAHSKAWATEMGMLDASSRASSIEIWNEHKFDSMDYALLASYTHPDTPRTELNLIADWYVWAFFFDDYFLEKYKRSGDLNGAKEHIVRLSIFMSVNASDTLPEPANPVERGLLDLWTRTMPTMSTDWRFRFTTSTQHLLEESLWELSNIRQRKIPNPIEYLEMRRSVGRASWSAELVEHAVAVEISSEIGSTRPMRLLKDSFSDGTHLRNDIFSYQREVVGEGELNNGVLVFEKFFNCDPQHAANLANNLLTSRLRQFENTALNELSCLFDEYSLSLKAQENLFRYVKGLQDWQSGEHEWHMRSSRYMNSRSGSSPPTNFPLIGSTGFGVAVTHIELFRRFLHPGSFLKSSARSEKSRVQL